MTGLVRGVATELGIHTRDLPVGVGMPGSVTRREGFVKNSNTICLNGRPFQEDLSRALEREAAFDNDANCFALAEARLGAGKHLRDGVVFGVILGTGVGGGDRVRRQTVEQSAGSRGANGVTMRSVRGGGRAATWRGKYATSAPV